MFLRLFAFSVTALCLAARLPAQTPSALWQQLAAQGRALAAEGSWTLATERLAAALAAAPADADTRELRLDYIRAQVPEVEAIRDWFKRSPHVDRLQQEVEAYLPRWDWEENPPLSLNDYELAVMETRIEVLRVAGRGEASAHIIRVANLLGEQPATPANLARLTGFVRRQTKSGEWLDGRTLKQLRPILRTLREHAPTKDDRVWAAFVLTAWMDHRQFGLKAQFREWQATRKLAAGTSLETTCEIGWFLWRVQTGWSATGSLGEPADIDALLAQARALKADLLHDRNAEKRSEYQRNLDRLIRHWSDPIMRLNVARHYLPDAPVDFSYAVAGITELHVELMRLDPYAAKEAGVVPELTLGLPGEPVGEWVIPIDAKGSANWHTAIHQLTPHPSPGYYRFKVRGIAPDGSVAREETTNFTIGAYQSQMVSAPLAETPDELLLLDAKTGEPVPNTPVHGFARPFNGEVVEWSFTTDANGRVQAPLTHREDLRQVSSHVIYGEAEGQVFVITDHNALSMDGLVGDLILDRPLYRPGETLHWKLILRNRSNGVWQVPTGTFGLKLLDTNHVDLFVAEQLQLDAYGSVDGEFDLPLDTPVGNLQVLLTLPDGRITGMEELCIVDNYVPPAISAKISFAGEPGGLRQGMDIPLKIRARYLSGGPAVSAAVEVSVIVRTTYRPNTPHGNRLEPVTLQGVTDKNGEAVLNWISPFFSNDALETDFSVIGHVLPPGGQPVTITANWQLTPSGYKATIDQDRAPLLAAPGETVTLTGEIRDGSDKPTSFHGWAELVRRQWRAIYLDERGEVVDRSALPDFQYHHPMPEGWAKLHEGYVETVVESHELNIAQGRFALEIKAPDAGLYQLRLYDQERRALNEANDESFPSLSRQRAWRHQLWPPNQVTPFVLVVADQDTPSLPLPSKGSALFLNDHAMIGDTAHALVKLEDASQPAVLTVAREGGTDSRILPVGPPLRWVDLSAFTDQPGNVLVKVFNLDLHQIAGGQIEVESPTAPLQLDVKVPAQVLPGETTTVSVKTTDAAGHPVPSQILHAVADDAVLQLVAGMRPDVASDTAPWLAFNSAAQFVDAQIHRSMRLRAEELKPIPDWRPGAIIRFTSSVNADGEEELVELSAFAVSDSSAAQGYASDSSLGLAERGIYHDEAAVGAFQQGLEPPPSPANSTGTADPPRLRKHFASTAAWIPAAETDAQGQAELQFTYPDNLTSWNHDTYALTADGRTFATATATSRTELPLQARLQTPRYLIAGDTSFTSVKLVDRSGQDSTVSTTLQLTVDDDRLGSAPPTTATTPLPADSEAIVWWPLNPPKPSQLLLTASAIRANDADAMQLPLPVLEDGILQHLGATARLGPGKSAVRSSLELPSPLDPARTTATLHLSTSPAIAALDALPYLIDFPYGCVEQTMSRFLPAVIVYSTLTKMGLDPAEVEARILGLETAAEVQRRLDTAGLSQLDEVIHRSLERLSAAQDAGSGGWGWWPGSDDDDPWMTAYVTWGLGLAQQAGLALDEEMLDSAVERCAEIAASLEHALDHRAWALAACAAQAETPANLEIEATLGSIFAQRDGLTPSARAALAIAVAKFGTDEQRQIITRNLANFTVKETSDLGTLVHWGSVRGHRRALEGAHEATALSVLALLDLDPDNALIQPAIAWLSLNRRSAHWDSTRSTTFAVLALTRQLVADFESPTTNVQIEVRLNGKKFQTLALSARTVLEQPLRVSLPLDALKAGRNQIDLRRLSRDDQTPVYATALAEAWATGESVNAAGHVITVERDFERLIPSPTVLGPIRFEPSRLASTESADATDQINVRLRLRVPHELHYLMVAIPKPAGCEPLNPLSEWDVSLRQVTADESSRGETSERLLFREEHDDHSAIFIDHIEPGEWELSLGLRAVTPGDYRALPATAAAMYVPEITANSDAQRVHINTP